MTALQSQFAQHFQAPATEDPMELTSDVDQRVGAGDDIDIDLDLTGDNLSDGEDEFMREDVNALADSISVDRLESHVANDDEMVDDSYAQGQVNEGSSVRDEDIEDAEYTGPELDEDTTVEPDLDHPIEKSEELFADYEGIMENQDQEQDYDEQELDNHEHHERQTMPETESTAIERVFQNGQIGLVNPTHDVAEVAKAETSDGYDVEVSKDATLNHAGADQRSETSAAEGLIAPEAKIIELVGEEALPASLDQEIMAQSNVEGSNTQEDDPLNSPAHLHPVVLDYQGDEMFLFPPVDQSGDHTATFLLTDEQLAYSTIGDLLEACRSVLKGSLSEQDELMIKIDDLDLHISESTVESASTKLSEIIDLYVRLQQNDGLENPSPMYMDLTSQSRFSRRLDVLQNALIEGKGLSQLRMPQETENDQQHGTEEEEEEREEGTSSHTVVLSSNETYASEQQPGEEAQASIDEYDSHSNPLHPENLLESDPAAPGTQSHPFTDVLHEQNEPTESQLGRDNDLQKAGIQGGLLSKAARSMESLEPAQPLAEESEFPREEESIVDDGDFIDYEDVEEPEVVTSSASSTLQGDAIDANAVQDNAVHAKTLNAETQEHRSPNDVRGNTVANEELLNDFVDEKDTNGVGVPVEEGQPSVAEILSQHWDDKDQGLYGHSNEEVEAPENDQDDSISETKLWPKASADNDQHEASAQYEDSASYHRDTFDEGAGQIKVEGFQVDDTEFNGREVEEYSSTRSLQSGSSGSERSFHEDDQESLNDLEAENELKEADRALADDDTVYVPQPSEGVDIQNSLVIDESVQTQEDDDEITYEDEEDDTDASHEPARAETNVAASPGSLKRARSLHEEDDAVEEDLQGAKRIRSG